MKIGVDLDNVLNDMNKKLCLLYTLKHNELFTIEDIKCWDMHKYVKIGKKIYDYFDNDLFANLTPLQDSIEITEELSKNHELFVITATSPKNMFVKYEWLKKYFPHISKNNIISTYRKDLIDVDLLIDDAPHNIVDFSGKTIILDYAWNRELDSRYPRAYNWQEIKERIDEMVDNN